MKAKEQKTATWQSIHGEFTFSEEDICNLDDIDYGKACYLIHGEFGTLAIAFADCEQDALDIAVDKGKLQGYMIPSEEVDVMSEEQAENLCFAGNEGVALDDTYLRILEMPKVKMSFVDLFNAQHGKGGK